MTERSDTAYEKVQTEAFTEQVQAGTYAETFKHSPYLTSFFAKVMDKVLPGLPSTGLTVLDAGCGTGVWLHFLHQAVLPQYGRQDTTRMFGFDLTPAMSELADRHLSKIAPSRQIKTGSILDDAAYRFDGGPRSFDLVFSFDVVQQLPVSMQFDAVRRLISATKPGGYCVIFDHERHSPYGRKMAFRKFLTSKFGIPLVPKFYCNAKYPPLEKFRQRVEREFPCTAEVLMPEDGRKRALVIHLQQVQDFD